MYVSKRTGLHFQYPRSGYGRRTDVLEGKIANCKASGKNGIVFLLCRQGRTYTIFYYVETEDEKYFNMSSLDRANLIAQFFKNKVYLK